MVLRIIEFIGKEILSANPYIDVFGANCITTRDGRIVNFIGPEKEDFGVSDIRGIGSYARIEPTIEYTDVTSNKTSSNKKTTRGSINFRFVLFQVNAVTDILNPAKVENKIWGDLQNINFKDYVGNESQIDLSIESSNLDFRENFIKEVGKDYEVGADSIIVALNCKLSWIVASDNCEVCSVTGISSLCVDGVNIVDQDGNVIAIVDCGKTYNVGNVVPSSRKITINGVTLDLSQDRSWTVSSGGGESWAQTLAIGANTGGVSPVVDTDDVLYIGNTSRGGIYDSSALLDRAINISNWIGNATISLHDSGKIKIDTLALELPQLTANRVPYVNASNVLVSSAITDTELGYLTGAISNIQTQLNGKEATITAGITSQYWRGDKSFQTLDTLAVAENTNLYFTTARVLATALSGLSITGSTITSSDSIITAFGKLQNQINGVLGGAIYQGVWNANTNSPTLTSGSGTKGYYYVVSVAGSTNLDGITDWKVGDWAIFNGTTWDKVDNTDAVSSVNGAIGAVTITVTGTSNRISVTGGSGLTPTIDISASYVGQTSITTLGTISTGTWNATAIGVTKGGTGLTTIASGSILAANSADTLTAITSTTGNKELINDAGVVSWSTVTGTGSPVRATTPTFVTNITTPIVYGSSASGGTLTIDSTSNSTKGAITFGTAGTSNQYIFNQGSSTSQFIIRERIGATTQGALYVGVASGSEAAGNYFVNYNGNLQINSLSSTTPIALKLGDNTGFTITPSNSTAVAYYAFATRSRSSLTTTSNIPVFDVSSNTQTWAAGTVPLQYMYYFRSQTMGFASGSTTTYVSGLTVEYTTRGTNATFGTSSGIYIPTLAYTSTTTAIGIDIELATGATNSYGIRINAGTTTSAPIKLTAGTNMTTAVAGVFEYDGTNLFFTRTGTTRQYVMVGASGATAPATNTIGVVVDYYGTSATRVLTTPNTWITYVEGGTTYKIPAYT